MRMARTCVFFITWAALTIFGAIATTTPASAGPKIGNGGGAWVCRSSNGTIRWVRLVDLFEASNEFDLTLKPEAGFRLDELVQQVQSRITAANPDFANKIAPYLRELNDLKPNPPYITYTSQIVQTVDDSFYRIKPASQDCDNGLITYEQVVNYKNDGLILVESELMNALDATTRAALVFHEAIYKFRREVRLDTDSIVTRRIVGLIFSDLPTEELKKQLEALGEKEFGDIGMKFSRLQPGTFMMGSAGTWSNKHQHPVTLTQPFEIQTTTVTQSQYARVMGINPSFFSKPEFCEKAYEVRDRVPMCPNHPVDSVNLSDALAFIAKLNDMHRDQYIYRLPTEAEWEYAARGGTTTIYFFGNDFYGKDRKLFDDYGWFDANNHGQTHEVAQKTPNPYGLYDMLGNVSQWTSDWYGEYQDTPATDPTGPSSGMARVARPNGCNGMGYPYMSFITQYSAARGWAPPVVRANCLGFRLVRVRRN